MDSTKSFSISKQAVWEAYQRVKANHGAAGSDGESITEFEEQLKDNLAAVDVRLSPEHVKLLDDASALPAEYPGWMVDFQNTRDPRGTTGALTEDAVRAAAARLK